MRRLIAALALALVLPGNAQALELTEPDGYVAAHPFVSSIAAQLEIRASWTPWVPKNAAPGTPLDMAPHVEAWGELLCTAVGLPPVPEGVAVMPSRRGQRGSGH